MKKLFVSLLLSFGFLFAVVGTANALNYTYKVYNPKLNKTYTAVFGTISISDTRYLWGFYTKEGQPLCVAQPYNTNTKNGLVGGDCTEFNTFVQFFNGQKVDLSKNSFGWREINSNTFFREMESIKQERSAQGKFEFNGNN